MYCKIIEEVCGEPLGKLQSVRCLPSSVHCLPSLRADLLSLCCYVPPSPGWGPQQGWPAVTSSPLYPPPPRLPIWGWWRYGWACYGLTSPTHHSPPHLPPRRGRWQVSQAEWASTGSPVSNPPHYSPHTGVEGRSAGSEELLLHPAQHTAPSVSPPCSTSVPRLPASSNFGVEGGSTRLAGSAADFMALYDRCIANWLQAQLTFNHHAAHQELIILCRLPAPSTCTSMDRRRCRRRRHRRRCGPAASTYVVMQPPAPLSVQETSLHLSSPLVLN